MFVIIEKQTDSGKLNLLATIQNNIKYTKLQKAKINQFNTKLIKLL